MSRRDIYYWKCDRPAAFHGTGPRPRADEVSEDAIRKALATYFGSSLPVAEPATVPTDDHESRIALKTSNGPESPMSEHLHVPLRSEANRAALIEIRLASATGQGNHLTWNAEIAGAPAFLRIENGPEGDDHLEMESALLGEVAKAGVPVPRVLGCDASRSRVPFAWQALERIPFPDLNHWAKARTLNISSVAFEIGKNVAMWQEIRPTGFGPFDLEAWREGSGLVGYHESCADYFRLRLSTHLDYLVAEAFLTVDHADEIMKVIDENDDLLEIGQGVLVHKDLALWNVLGPPDRVAAFIDFDDAISGDPMDDLSLLACFHDAAFLERAVAGYTTVRSLPEEWRRRFWLHLLRNLIVKAVIRVGAGYFERDSGFFLIGSGASGADLKQFTEERIETALRGLRESDGLSIL